MAIDQSVPTKPVPHPSEDSGPYWDGARRGVLMLQRCANCATARHYPRLVCDQCYSLESKWEQASGRGKVHSWTVAHHPFHPAFAGELPYTLVIVDLDEGPRAMGRYHGTTPLALGLPVRIGFERSGESMPLPFFQTIE